MNRRCDHPSVCVAIPVYNGETFLAAAVESALGQDYPNLKVAVSDNASTDGTREICAGFKGDRFSAHHFQEHVPVAESWGRALRHASGDFIMLLSADNVLEPGAVRKLVAALTASPACGFAYGQSRVLLETYKPNAFIYVRRQPRLGIIHNVERLILQDGFTIALDSAMFRGHLAELWIDGAARNACDLDLFLRLGQAGVKGVGIVAPVLARREHATTLSSNLSVMWTVTLETLERHQRQRRHCDLYRLRIARVLLWAILDALQRREPDEARGYWRRFGATLKPHQRLLVHSFFLVPSLSDIALRARAWWFQQRRRLP